MFETVQRLKESYENNVFEETSGLSIEQIKQNLLINILDEMDSSENEIDLNDEKKSLGYSLLESLLEDDEIEEIMAIGHGRPVYVYHRKKGMLESNVIFQDPGELEAIIKRIAKRGRRWFYDHYP